MPDTPEPQTESWVFTGRHPAAKGSGLLGGWLPADSTDESEERYWSQRGDPYVIGGIYELQIIRHENGSMTRSGDPRYSGKRLGRDDPRVSRWEISDRQTGRAKDRELATKRHKADTRLAEAIIPLQQIAANLKTSSQFATFQEYVTEQLSRAFYTKKAPVSKGASSWGGEDW